jgi:hypothetical protein
MTKWIPTLSLAIHEKKALYITSTGVLETGALTRALLHGSLRTRFYTVLNM